MSNLPHQHPAPAPDSAPRPAWPWCLCRWGHGLCRQGWRAFLVLLCLVLYLWLIGIPGSLVNRWLERADPTWFRPVVERVRLDPTAGLVVDGLFLYARDDYSEPLARLHRVVLLPGRRPGTAGLLHVRALEVDQGILRLPPLTRSNLPPVRVNVRRIGGRLEFHPDRVDLAPLRLYAFGLNWQATGSVLRLSETPSRGPWAELRQVLDAFAQAPAAAADVAEELNALRFDTAALARVGFRFTPGPTNHWSVHAQAQGRQAAIRGAVFDRVQADLTINDYRMDVRDITLGARGQRGQLQGRVDLDTRQAEARLYSDLPPQPWISMMPRRWQQELRSAGLTAAGALKSEVWIGPAPLDDLARALRGWVALEKATLRGIPLEKGYFAFQVAGDTVSVEQATALVGTDTGRGPLEGRLTWHRGSGLLAGDLDLKFDPHLVLPILSSNQARLVRRFTFSNQPPAFAGRFLRKTADAPLFVEGRLAAGNLTYREVALTSVVAQVKVENHVVSLKPWSLHRPEGSVTGEMHVAWPDQLVTVDLAGWMDPHAIAGLVGPGLQHVLAPARFAGPGFLHARGTVDIAHPDQRTDLHLYAEGRDMGVGRWMAESARFDLAVQGGRYQATNVTGLAFGGPFRAEVLARQTGTSLTYEVTALITNMEMARLAAHIRTNVNFDQKGRMRILIRVAGPAPDPGLKRMTGSGLIHVDDGEIMRLPLFGGLSRLLSGLYPGLGFAAQDDLHADFEIRNGRAETRSARLEGALISMQAAGYYAWDGKLRFNVEVQLLRKGPLASVLRLITLPVTKLLMFQLSGSVQDPQWRPVNLPKELFLIFE